MESVKRDIMISLGQVQRKCMVPMMDEFACLQLSSSPINGKGRYVRREGEDGTYSCFPISTGSSRIAHDNWLGSMKEDICAPT